MCDVAGALLTFAVLTYVFLALRSRCAPACDLYRGNPTNRWTGPVSHQAWSGEAAR